MNKTIGSLDPTTYDLKIFFGIFWAVLFMYILGVQLFLDYAKYSAVTFLVLRDHN